MKQYLESEIEEFERLEKELYDIGTLEDSKYTSFGRTKPYKNRKDGKITYMGISAVKEYLGIGKDINVNLEKEIRKEFNQLEIKYGSKNVDFCLNEDIRNNKSCNYNILESGKLLSVFTF